MSSTPNPELLTEAAGVKIIMTPLADDDHPPIDHSITGKICVTLENVKATKALGKSCGFHLTKSKWDLYPWVSYVENGSLADVAGLRVGDCLIGINGADLMGLKIKQIATLVHREEHEYDIQLTLWRYPDEKEEQTEGGMALKGPLPDVAGKLANAISGAVRALECPVCLESSMPPVSQCVHGHIICVGCRPRTPRCPVCRVRLGQGRCLLADKLHKTFRDIFDVKNDSRDTADSETWSLRERLFGKAKKKRVTSTGRQTGAVPKARQLLLTKLFLGGLGKAASADNLTDVSGINQSSDVNEVPINNACFSERLTLHDRMKSASTGELSRDSKKEINNSNLQTDATNSMVSSTNSLVSSIPQTPTWGGSMDSVSCVQVTCPLLKQCVSKDTITAGMLLEHLNRAHSVPQVHFHSANIKIPLPFPFGSEAVYIIHHAGDLFFLHCEEETLWISCIAGENNTWEWILHGWGECGTEIKLRRNVASLEDPLTLSPEHVAPIPSALSLNTLNIHLIECRSQERMGV